MTTEILLLAIKRRLRHERADILYYVPISHRRKLWKLVAKGIEVQAVAGKSDKICTIVRAIDANYGEMSENCSFPGTVQTLFWVNVILTHVAPTSDFRSAT